MASVRCEGVIKNFGDVRVLNGIDLDIQDGEFIVSVGPSGCGKTTLLRLIAGLEEITEGSLYIGRERVNDVPPKQRNIAMVFQNYAIYPHMTVAENISFGMKIRGSTKADMEIAVNTVATILGLTDLLHRKPKQLSGGQRQRVAMGRAIIRDPAVFLMDEPLSNLDARLRTQMRVEIKSLQRRLRTTTIYVTHDQVEAMTLADRIAIMKDGEIQQFGIPDELYSKPSNKFVASFIGTPQMNFLKAERSSERELTLSNGCRMVIPPLHEGAIAKLAKIEVGIRPEKIRIAHDFASQDWVGSVRWRSSVRLFEALGSETIVHFDSSGDALQAKVGREITIMEGDDIDLVFDIDSAYFFCGDTGVCVGHALKG